MAEWFEHWSYNIDSAGSILGQVDIFINSVLFYKYPKCPFYEYPANISHIFLSKIIVAFLSALSKSDLQGSLNIACANLLYLKDGIV